MPIFWTTDTLALSFVHLALAVSVTGHVLLHKRNVGSSIAWIGLAWLSPILGSILYLVFGINRVRARAIVLKEKRAKHAAARPPVATTITDTHLSPLELAVGRITGRPAEEGNDVVSLRNGDEAYPRMLAAIAAARSSIALSTYIFRADNIGLAFIEALTKAHRRGVEVRVIIDGIGGGYIRSPAYRLLRRNGVPVARFLHSLLPWRMPFLNLRTHKKLLSIDGQKAFTGGLNIGDENCIFTKPRFAVRDTHFLFAGPVVGQLNDVFAEDWYFVTGEQLAGDAWFPAIDEAGPAIARAIASGPDQDNEKIESVILQAIACARRSIKIVTPYFLPDDRIMTSLALAAMRGIDVGIFLPEKTNHFLIAWAMRAQIGRLIAAGCRVSTDPPPFDHSKIMAVDGAWALIGSANWDTRSFRLNFELDVEVHHPEFVERLEAFLDAKQRPRLVEAELLSRPLALRLRDRAARLLLPYL